MVELHWARIICLAICLSGMVACSNGRGSVEEEGEQQGEQQNYNVGGAVSGLEGAGLVLQLNGAGDLAVEADGAFTFASPVANGATYDVTVLTQPSGPAQTCEVSNGAGRVSGAAVTNIAVVCTSGGAEFPIGGELTGLVGSGLVLRNNGGDDLALDLDGEFIFPTPVARGATYNVTVAAQPSSPAQTCSIQNPSGVVQDGEVTNILVVCSTSSFRIGGRVNGLTSQGLVLQQNGETLEAENGPFTFPTPIASGAAYAVTVAAQPVGQNCTVQNGSGQVADANVTDIVVTCAANVYTVGGAVSGLAPNARVVLTMQSSGRTIEHTIRTNGRYDFPEGVSNGGGYAVDVKQQPQNPSQRCVVSNRTGIVAAANVTNVDVACTTNTFRIGGAVEGYAGSGLVLRLNGGDDLAIASNGAFTFATPIASGARYEASVASQPTNPSQTCTIAQRSGTVGGEDVRNIRVTCATNTYAVRGTVAGLLGDRVVLENNGANPVSVEGDGAFEFLNVASGSNYNVTVRRQPANPTQACSVANGVGTIVAQDVTNVAVACVTSSFAVGGSVSGLAGTGLVLRNNGGDDLAVQGNGPFSFATAVQSGAQYAVTVAQQPINPLQVCTVSNGGGTVGGGNVTNVQVACVTVEYTVGGTVSGLAGSGLTLQNNGGEPVAIAADGPFTMPVSIPNGQPYNVSVATQPLEPSQTCVASNNVGTINGADVTNVAITCTTNSFTVGGVVTGVGFFPIAIQINGGETLLRNDGAYTFPTALLSGTPYTVTVTPSSCAVENATGTVGAQNITNVNVSC